MRLQRFLAQAGIASRRKAEELIVAGRVAVNGNAVVKLGTTVAEDDVVTVDRRRVTIAAQRTYLALNKPAGVVTTMRDPQGRRTVAELLPKNLPGVVPVGRLDYDTSGLLLFMNDGELAHRLMHPRFGVEKTYRA
ncbi:MAG: rRNA pseudouridine synthase, partial [Candidatus Eremiobacteraeota bacterium]|nr:rRNA pseudouridine synthase [Candidatus Eremiobacteraeota bacterium]